MASVWRNWAQPLLAHPGGWPRLPPMTLPKQVLALVLAIALGVTAGACAPIAPGEAGASPGGVLDAARGAVLPLHKVRDLAVQCSREKPGPIERTWWPGAGVIRKLEAGLGDELARQLATVSNARSPRDYYRQYAGFVIGGRQIVYVNGIDQRVIERTSDGGVDVWRSQAIGVCDGGSVTFGVEYDPATDVFSNFAFNGAY